MSLTVSILVPDGIVLASDSLLSIQTQLAPKADIGVKCPQCQHDFKVTGLPLPPITLPAGSSPYGQKLFNIGTRNIGVLTYGQAFLTGRTIENHVREFEKKKIGGKETIEEVADELIEYFSAELKKESFYPSMPEDVSPIGFQVAGYDSEDTKIGKTYILDVAKKSKKRATHENGYSATWGGDGRVIQKLWKQMDDLPIQPTPNFQHLSVQDAVEYAEFLISATISFQRFIPMVPTVGGPIDIAVITHWGGFKWIKRKELNRVLESKEFENIKRKDSHNSI